MNPTRKRRITLTVVIFLLIIFGSMCVEAGFYAVSSGLFIFAGLLFLIAPVLTEGGND